MLVIVIITSFTTTFYPHMPISFTVCFACLFFVCTVTNFPGRIKLAASNCAGWFRWFSHFGELCSPETQNRTNRRWATTIADRRQSPPLTASAPSVEGTGVYRQYLLSACVDIRPSPKTDVFVSFFVQSRYMGVMVFRFNIVSKTFGSSFLLDNMAQLTRNVAECYRCAHAAVSCCTLHLFLFSTFVLLPALFNSTKNFVVICPITIIIIIKF